MLDFWDRQERARRDTRRLMWYFALAIFGITVAVYPVGLMLSWMLKAHHGVVPSSECRWWDSVVFLWVFAATSGIIFLGALRKLGILSQGGAEVALYLRGKLVDLHTENPDERKLINVVEEMAIASGIPTPDVYLLRGKGINAFAAGNDYADTVIGVTKGCIQHLTRDELQGVIAHEFSHILHGDTRLNMRMMGLLHGILEISLAGQMLLAVGLRLLMGRLSCEDDPEKNREDMREIFLESGVWLTVIMPVVIIGLFVIMGNSGRIVGIEGFSVGMIILGCYIFIIGVMGAFFARMIKGAISRQREFLADAYAMQLTRNPDGIAGALKKIGGMGYGSLIATPWAEEASHLFFANGMKQSFFDFLSTHPSLDERILAIDPTFDGKFSAIPFVVAEPPPPASLQAFLTPENSAQVVGLLTGKSVPREMISSNIIAQNIGTPNKWHLQYAEDLKKRLSPILLRSMHDSLGACAIVCGLLMDREISAREQQWECLKQKADANLISETQRLLPALDSLEQDLRFPLVQLSIPALRQLSKSQYLIFKNSVRTLIEADEKIHSTEYGLQYFLTLHLDAYFDNKIKMASRSVSSFTALLPHIEVTLSYFANLHGNEQQRIGGFEEGRKALNSSKATALKRLPPEQTDFIVFQSALKKISTASLPLKRNILYACATVATYDGRVEPQELETLRILAETLGCPIPPFVMEC